MKSIDMSGALLRRFELVRSACLELCSPLMRDDYQVQSADFVSPPKWHLAHTSWFFETFILARFDPGYRSIDPRYAQLFNSYYESFGEVHNRPRRGHLSRPTLEEVLAYRRHVDQQIVSLAQRLTAGHDPDQSDEAAYMLLLGINHEEQHQELMLMDIKHILYMNPLRPEFWSAAAPEAPAASLTASHSWIEFLPGVHRVGAEPGVFSFDNESPAHPVHVGAFAIASRPVTNGEFHEFIADGGYDDPLLWLSDGWAKKRADGWRAPLYWELIDGSWHHFTLHGMRLVEPQAPVCHLSYYEALAYAHWRGARLPTEYEWEIAARTKQLGSGLVWEWTQSAYAAYPGYRVSRDALGEYNGKFMINQMVLRGSSPHTSQNHARSSYRNFYHPHMRWQFGGMRLLEDR